MNYSEHALNVLTAKTYKGIGRAWIYKNLNRPLPEAEIISLLNKSLKEDEQIMPQSFELRRNRIENLLKQSGESMDGVAAIGEQHFPAVRGEVNAGDQPVFLFYKGDLSLLGKNSLNIAVIGLLNPDKETVEFEKSVVSGFTQKGAVIVSGLALGCDTAAHEQALDDNAKTAAVLPGPLSKILPATNKTLADRIVQSKGLLITEYLTEAKSKRELTGRYQERNRLQALFSDAVILTASYAKNNKGNDSGSRMAMDFAKKYGIPRGIMYNEAENASNPKYDLNRQLLTGDKNVIIINSNNIEDRLRELFQIKRNIDTDIIQKNLFG